MKFMEFCRYLQSYNLILFSFLLLFPSKDSKILCTYSNRCSSAWEKFCLSCYLLTGLFLLHFYLCRFVVYISFYINLEILMQVVLLCYPFLWLKLYLHLFKQRRSKLGKHDGKKRRWRFELILAPINYLVSVYFGHRNSDILFHGCGSFWYLSMYFFLDPMCQTIFFENSTRYMHLCCFASILIKSTCVVVKFLF